MAFRDWIKTFFSKDKEQKVADEARGISAGAVPSSSMGAPWEDGQTAYSALGQMLSIDSDLMRRYADYENMDDYPETCLSGESTIFTVERGWVPIGELAETQEDFHVLAYDRELKSLVPAEASRAKMTGLRGHEKPMVRVVMDDGRSISCTADHRFMTKGGGWIAAGNLSCGERLMPGVVRLRSLNSAENQPYWQVHQPHHDSVIRGKNSDRQRRWVWVHRLVAELINRDGGQHVHHIDGNPLNNAPSNLEGVSLSEHAHRHIADLDNSQYFPEWTAEKRREMSHRMKGNTYRRGCVLSAETRKKMSDSSSGHRKDDAWRKKIGLSQPTRINLSREQIESALLKGGSVAGAAKILGVSYSTALRRSKSYDLLASGGNHRVMSVEPIEGGCPVYDISVPGYMNFVCNGVVVHNSAALDNYADCATIPDSVHGKTIWATSRDKIVRDLADDCLHRRIRIEEDIWPAVRTLCKYGNCYAEVLVSEIGVVGLNWLPVPTVRRIVDDRGSLIGFVQDTTGSFGFDYKAVVEAMKNSRLPDTEGDPKDAKLIFFRTWELVHWRLRSKMIRAQYGYSVLDAARWVWKRLVLMEDTALVQKLCLHGDTKIWTSCGVKNIRDLAEGDEVYSYTVDDELKKTRVVYKKHNGKDKIFRIKSAHRELYANETHPVLVEEIIHGGSGRSLARSVKYVEVKDLEPGVHRWMTPCKEDHLSEDVELLFPALDKKARLSVSAIEDGVELTVGPKRIHDEFGADIGYVRDFFGGERWMTAGTIGRILEANGTSLDYLDYKDDWGGADGSRLPKYASDDFARLFGFLIGDGFASERKFEKDGRECFVRTVGFSAGDNEEINEKYRVLFENFFGHAGFVRDKRSQHGCVGYYYVSSKKLYEFMVLNGFIPGAHNKRVPEWVFRSPVSVRQAFLDGLADADGYTEDCNVSTERNRVRHKRVVLEMCNKDLVEDVRDLAMQLGFRVGSVRSRVREGGRSIDDDRFVLGDARSYTVEWSYDRQPISEVLNSVESVDVDDIWDIGVESDEHNFVANGVVVHNTRAPGRYAFYVDTGDLPPREAMALVKKVKRAYKKKSLLDPATGNLDFRYNPLCVAADTEVPMLDGTKKTVVEMAEAFESGDEQWVYGIDRKNGNKIVPGKVVWAGKTRRNADLVRVTLDNGESFRVTPDHKCILRSGEVRDAEDLTCGDSLMPLRRLMSTFDKGDTLDGYEKVYDPATKKYVYTHRMVARSCGIYEKGKLIHHDQGKLNNDPRFLKSMTYAEHSEHHCRLGQMGGAALAEARKNDPVLDQRLKDAASRTLKKLHEDPAYRARKSVIISETNRRRDSARHIREYNRSPKHAQDNTIRSDAMKTYWTDDAREAYSKFKTISYSREFLDVIENFVCQNPGSSADAVARFVSSDKEALRLLNEGSSRKIEKAHRHLLLKAYRSHGYKGFSDFKESVCSFNHKVVSVERLAECEDTYTLTVEGCHNFGISAGVVVCNSPHEDFFIPTRGGKESTRIEVMSGPDVQMMDDVEYFQGKLVAATKVPKSYMGLGDSADETSKSLSQADVRFARACMRVQREFIMGVRKIIRVHLAALNIDPESAMWTIKMTVPSAIFEMQQIEILNAQAALASSMTEWTSKPWILQHIFHFSEDDAAFISRDKDDESDDMAKKEAGTQADIMRLYPELQEMPPVAEEPPMGESDLGNEIIGLKKMFEETGQTYPLVVKRFEKLESMMTGMQKSLKMRAVSGGRR